ncbi:unnamed protein product [Rotaria socialis]|uniref:Uncharacterized protein n=2 Tax=Rotaria socialis TaxID=392032 RepID=A0A820FPU2_9BILA|nr:unnamed protein product [Rotaria socialis]CAF4265086.1 unnamed protein product [Rotaria socialis]
MYTFQTFDEKENYIIKNIQINNCSKRRRVLCKADPFIVQSEHRCFRKPLTLGLPAIISNYLTHELCLSVCKKLELNAPVININKCYCFHVDHFWIYDFVRANTKNGKKNCANPCPVRISNHSIQRCSQTSMDLDRNCIVLRYQETSIHNETKYERCFSASNKCSAQFAVPVCVDLQMQFNSTVIPLAQDEGSLIISINLSTDYSCGDDIVSFYR